MKRCPGLVSALLKQSHGVQALAGGRRLSSRPCPTCCMRRGAPIGKSLTNARTDVVTATTEDWHTLGSVTLGITTTLRAEGASFFTLVSPPGWYWYGLEPPDFQGSLCSALETARSEEALVGERAARVQYWMAPWCVVRLAGELTEVPACEAEDTAHDGQEHLRDSISLQLHPPTEQGLAAYIELGVALRSGPESVLAGLPLGLSRVRGGDVAGPAAGGGGGAKAGGSAEG
ncbi:hypothetical protein OPT61_g6511 [Boeremia exigua]|uniref:Uncharacterized protein n=1 Tax=Boeremia exigua TaxID=749465 RepID=A0ACC2I6C2_9PLEO|nr:hypothetical protein OPT61_g6511 [Boeremia exigua]